jgi:hypothetical protein
MLGRIKKLAVQWRTRNLTLACPYCKSPSSRLTFERARFMLGEQTLTCEQCGRDSFVTLWRFEGTSSTRGND